MQFQITEDDINNVINIMEKRWFFNKANQIKKKYRQIIILWIIWFIIIGVISLYINPIYIALILILLIIYVVYFFSKFSNELKNSLIKKEYIKLLKKELDYSAWNDLFPLSVDEFYDQSGLLSSYEYIDLEEDSISLKTANFNLYWEEIKTSREVEDSEWHRTREITNHAYIILIEILDHRFPIKTKVKLIPDIQNSVMKFLIAFILWTVSSLLWYSVIIVLDISISKSILYLIIFVLFVTWVFLFFYFLNKNRVKLESKEFEKIFDVYSENEIEARRLLTPKMMGKLSNFANNSKYRWLGLTFEQNRIYIKFDVNTFLEFSLFGKDMKMQIKNFFYQIKLIIDFLNRVNMEYFSESDFLKERK